jgi:MOSC domain-containing protein YiiM
MARVVSVNVGAVRTVDWHGRAVATAIWKSPVAGRIAVRGVNLEGDDQADRRVHGGPDKAVYAYGVEDYAWWSAEQGRNLAPGTFGENLTVEGIDLGQSVVGTRWQVGSTVLEVSQPRQPCFKLGIRMGDAEFVERFEAAARFGAYLRIVREGEIGAGDTITVAPRAPGITVAELGLATRDSDAAFLRRVADDDLVPAGWRDWAARQLARQ